MGGTIHHGRHPRSRLTNDAHTVGTVERHFKSIVVVCQSARSARAALLSSLVPLVSGPAPRTPTRATVSLSRVGDKR